MHRWCILIIVQRDATHSTLVIILRVHSTCFWCQLYPSSGVHKTITTASGTVQLPPSNVVKLASSRWREAAAQNIWPVLEAVVTVLCNPDDGCGWHPKHVEWTCRIINRLLCVASRWTIINTNQFIIYREIIFVDFDKYVVRANCRAFNMKKRWNMQLPLLLNGLPKFVFHEKRDWLILLVIFPSDILDQTSCVHESDKKELSTKNLLRKRNQNNLWFFVQ